MNYNDMQAKKTFADKLNEACTRNGIPFRGRAKYIQDRLSSKISITAIRKWLVGDALPETKRIGELAVIVNASVEELLGDEVNESLEVRVNAAEYGQVVPSLLRFEVPILSWVQAGAFCSSESQIMPQDCDTILCPNRSASARTFALRVVGDSMTAPYGKSYPEGTIIYVDPEKEPLPGKRVIARTDQGHTFKELAINEFGEQYLKALNPHHQPIFGEGIEICGVVVGSYMGE
ncbi:LexA family protein [Vibrio sp. TRT 17S01]|uniref:LexA family protein n=1 Tax=Vibrio sp. TRT 17S01 TaxID=3418505 RepID=UPI003CEA07D5